MKSMIEVRCKVRQDWNSYKSGVLMTGAILLVLALLGTGICPLSYLWGLPCPGCGITRSVLLLAVGRWEESWQMHPFAVVWIVFAIALIWERYFEQKDGRWKKVVLVILLLGMFLFYIYRMITMFPDREPMIYIEQNLTERAVPGYGKLMKHIIHGQFGM